MSYSKTITREDLTNILNKVATLSSPVRFLGVIGTKDYKQSAANTWQYIDFSFTVPQGHKYLVSVYAGWGSGKPIGVGIYTSSTLGGEGYPRWAIYDANGMMQSPVWALDAGTYYVFCKRATVPSAKNYHAVVAWDFSEDIMPVRASQVDYVVEQGTSGIWTYRKWNSGIAECWGKYTQTITNGGSVLGGYYYSSNSIAYPSNLFIEEPNAQYSGRVGSGYCLCGTLYNANKNSIQMWVVSQMSGSQSCTFFITAKGRWK